jgi:hypothetical protein
VLLGLLRKWKDIDLHVTEAGNEAKDNVKYLSTLEKLIEPLYKGSPADILDTVPALMNSLKMIHSIARYFNTPERMTDLFVKITTQMIANCTQHIVSLEAEDVGESLWRKNYTLLLPRLEVCLKLNELYQETYRLTKEKLALQVKGKQFSDFNEAAIFGRFDSFCRRCIKLLDLFGTILQYRTLEAHQIEGLGPLIKEFDGLVANLQARRHNLLSFTDSLFDRDYVEFTMSVEALETKLQKFIHRAFENIKSVEASLEQIEKFRRVLQRESLSAELDDKVTTIFTAFGRELEMVTALYEEQKHAPAKPRNLPPVAGNIAWSRNLLTRIERPMKVFEARYPQVFTTKEGKAIVRSYNRIARTLVAYECLWHSAWVEAVETAKAGLQATLIIRHPDDGRLYVNFDAEVLQLIREARCLDRLGLTVPESARIIVLQESKFKRYFNDLSHCLDEYTRISNMVVPVSAELIKPALQDLEYRLRPGMITLTWTSMNIDAYKSHVTAGLARLEELIRNVNDIIENRIENNLRVIARTSLINLPQDRSFSLDEFVDAQQDHIHSQLALLHTKNVEVERAVRDLVSTVRAYSLDTHIAPVSDEECIRIVEHYNHFTYTALLYAVKTSLNGLKKRVAARGGSNDKPFFELEVQLFAPEVRLNPSLEDVQAAINKCAVALLGATRALYDWRFEPLDSLGVDHNLDGDEAPENWPSYFERITKDIEIVRVVLLLTGSIRGARIRVEDFLGTFSTFSWLWTRDADAAYRGFEATNPSISDYERELSRFSAVEDSVNDVPPIHCIGALSLQTVGIKGTLKALNSQYKAAYSENLHRAAANSLASLMEYLKSTISKLNREPDGLDSIKYLMDSLAEIREREAVIDTLINPIMDMYALLEVHLAGNGESFMTKDEMDNRAMLRIYWSKLRERADEVQTTIVSLQSGFRRRLLVDVKQFRVDVTTFREEYLKSGPMVAGITPNEAMDRLRRYEDEFDIYARKRDLYCSGEDLFSLPLTDYPEMDAMSKELQLLGKLYGLYKDVMTRMDEWRTILWVDVVANIQAMSAEMESFASRCRKMPKRLRQWDAYSTLNKRIEDVQTVLPLMQELSKASMRPRHWEAIEKLAGVTLNVADAEFRLAAILDAPLVEHRDEILEVTDGADKELAIQRKLEDANEKWAVTRFFFQPWKARGVSIIVGVGGVVEELEEAQLNLQTMLSMRHVAVFREPCQEKLKELSDTAETLELWQKVQMLWCSLESVFLGGDIAKQMPVVAKRFQKIDKDFVNIMGRSVEIGIVVECCKNEILKLSLPSMYDELEKCQKSLEGYLEQKRNKFPRFYFVSNPVLLQILSQGSDPLAVQQYYEKIFDSISNVEHDKKDKVIIKEMISREGRAEERITFRRPVKAQGNIEDWLTDLLREMQRTMKALCEECAAEMAVTSNDLGMLRKFTDNTCGQYSLLGLQFMWTADVENALNVCRKDKNAMRLAAKKTGDVLNILSSWCLQDLGSKMNRTKIETLVTIQVHQRDVINDLFALYRGRRIAGADDFEWLKQVRFYWEPEGVDAVDDKGACRIKVTDVPFEYQYEYLGCKERLVITPLTDRCYITLAQAMGMNYGGSPAGPAGTGKTETVKDFGRSLGIYVVVTNCLAEDTQVLTNHGFMFLDEIQAYTGNDLRFATCETNTKQLMYEQASRLIVNEAKEQTMVEFAHASERRRWMAKNADSTFESDGLSNGVSLMVTPNHDMFVKTGTYDFSKKKAADLLGNGEESVEMLAGLPGGIAAAAGAEGPFATALGLTSPEQIDAFLDFYGFWLGEGSLTFTPAGLPFSVRVGAHEDRDIAYLRDIIPRMGLDMTTDVAEEGPAASTGVVSFDIVNKSWCDFFVAEYGAKDVISAGESAKSFAPWVWGLGKAHLRSILSGLRRADGTEATEENVIHTSSTSFRDDIVRVALHAGYAPWFQKQSDNFCGNPNGILEASWRITYCEFGTKMRGGEPALDQTHEVSTVRYNGHTWCVTVPSGLLVARRAMRGPSGEVEIASKAIVIGNCTDQMRYTDCAKIFKGLCMAGLWGCFDEFNRITLPVLSVVAQQVLAILNAKKANANTFFFPGDSQAVNLNPAFGAFITMNPGYAGRQELPENLKALFRGVAMMVPDREIIMKVKLCSVGYSNFPLLAHKFFICYQLCEEQLSKCKHYDFGLRNILSVLRTAGATKRENLDADEEMLLYRTLRDMNLSKLVAQDVPLFISMLTDLFPSISSPPKREYPAIEAAIRKIVDDTRIVPHATWITKVIQLYETNLVRHGIMLVGPTAGGKSRIMEVLTGAIQAVDGKQIRSVRLNPKAIQAHEMYGQTDPASGEWIKGVFAAIWEKYNNRDLPYITWVTLDGPVDAIWIEDLNSVLDDNKLLTLASGDRIPMTDNVKIMFETESLANASPATVSRAGIIFVSETDLDWKPVADAWIASRPTDHQAVLKQCFLKYIGNNTPQDAGHLFDFLARSCTAAMSTARTAAILATQNLIQALTDAFPEACGVGAPKIQQALEKIIVFALVWTVGGLLETDDRVRFDQYFRTLAPDAMPKVAAGETVYEYVLDNAGGGELSWSRFKAPLWNYPDQEKLDFSNLLVPTMDSTRSIYLIDAFHRYRRPVLMIGGPGTAKTSTALMYFSSFDVNKQMMKRVNFSSATTPGLFQESIESELDKRGGKSFGPPGGKRMTVFIDDVSMPSINTWGDQPTNELVRQLIEFGGFYFLDKDKRGDFKTCEDLQYISAMNHPGGGRNDIPNRLKRQFFVFNLVLPALASIDDLYGQMLRGRFGKQGEFSPAMQPIISKLTTATIELWRRVKAKMLPTPAKFHYIFNMRELSRVFQGVLFTPKDTIKTGGLQTPSTDQVANLLRLWKHECARVFEDKLINNTDKAWYATTVEEVVMGAYGPQICAQVKDEALHVDFFREVRSHSDCCSESTYALFRFCGMTNNFSLFRFVPIFFICRM